MFSSVLNRQKPFNRYVIFSITLIILLLSISPIVNAQDNDTYDTDTYDTDTVTDDSESDDSIDTSEEIGELEQIKDEISSIKKDVQKLKDKTEWFNFKFEGSARVTWGASIWATEATSNTAPILNPTSPITQGFDFDNNFRFNIDLGKKVVANGLSKSEYGTEVEIKLKIDSFGLDKIKPKGSWYILDATDDLGNPVQLYFPRLEGGSSNILLGNMQLAIEEASVKKILGTGMFISYKDVTEVHHYYGIEGIADIMKLNHEYFNNGYVVEDLTDDTKYASLYYSFDPEFYEPENLVSEAVKFWTNDMLYTKSTTFGNNPYNYNNDTSRYNQRPHGISIGFDKKLADGFRLYVEGGAASKDAFDPKYFTDNAIDYGFFVRGGPEFFKKDRFSFHPQIAISFAFQTDTTTDVREEWSTLGFAATLPFMFKFPKSKTDYLNLDFSVNLNYKIQSNTASMFLSFVPEFVLLNEKLSISMPIIYSFKNGNGGFISTGIDDGNSDDDINQIDNHMFFFGLVLGFDSKSLFGNNFQYKVTNKLYLNVNHQFTDNSIPEIYFYELLENRLLLNNLGAVSFALFLNFGVGFSSNARLIYSNYGYDTVNNIWINTDDQNPIDWSDPETRWSGGTVLDFSLGFEVEVIKNFKVGFVAESPKLLMMTNNPIGNQQSFGTFKLWTEISL